MPGFDKTGPQGAGPRTGRGMGLCGPYGSRGIDATRGGFRGVGRGGAHWGGRRRRCFGGRGAWPGWSASDGPAGLSPVEETEQIKAQLASAEEEIAALKMRLEELSAQQ